ncbi:MAG: hypothetical protein SF029_05270 [bacterium]|nr:hypothetical protein [bacterium]
MTKYFRLTTHILTILICTYFLSLHIPTSGALHAQESADVYSGTLYFFDRDEQQIWSFNLATSEFHLKYQTPKGVTLTIPMATEHENLLLAMQGVGRFWVRGEVVDFQVVEINLSTGTDRVVYEGQHPASIQRTNLPNYYLIRTYRQNVESIIPIYDMCLFNLELQTCQRLHDDTAEFIGNLQYFNGTLYWLSTNHVLVNNPFVPALYQVDVGTGEITHVLPEWGVWSFAKIPNTDDLLFVASPIRDKDEEYASLEWGLYQIDVSLRSEPRQVVSGLPRVDALFLLTDMWVSPNHEYVLFFDHSPPTTYILGNLTDGTYRRLDTEFISQPSWIGDGATLIGITEVEIEKGYSIAQYDVSSNTLITLIEGIDTSLSYIIPLQFVRSF